MELRKTSPDRRDTALLVGSDEVLLYTRKAILERQGFTVTISSPVNSSTELDASHYDVIIACHTLKSEEADTLVQTARALRDPPALVGFTKGLAPKPTAFPFDASVWSLASPEAFLGKVNEVLTQHHH